MSDDEEGYGAPRPCLHAGPQAGFDNGWKSGAKDGRIEEWTWMVWAVGPGRLSEGGVWYLAGVYPTEEEAKAWARSRPLRTPVVMQARPWDEKPEGTITWGKRKPRKKAIIDEKG